MRTGKGGYDLHQTLLVVSGVVLGAVFSADCMSQSLWKESQSLRAYDGPARPREELALVRWGTLSALTVESVDGKAASEWARAAGQKEIMADTMKNRIWHSPHRLHWPYGCLLLRGEHVLVVIPRSGGGESTLRFVAERGEEYKLTYEELERKDTGFFVEKTVRPVIVRLSTKQVVSAPVEVRIEVRISGPD